MVVLMTDLMIDIDFPTGLITDLMDALMADMTELRAGQITDLTVDLMTDLMT